MNIITIHICTTANQPVKRLLITTKMLTYGQPATEGEQLLTVQISVNTQHVKPKGYKPITQQGTANN